MHSCTHTIDERDAKLRGWDRFRQTVPRLSASALSSGLELVDAGGAPEFTGRKYMHEAVEAILIHETPYGPMRVAVDVHGTRLECIHPIEFPRRVCRDWGAYADMVQECLRARPPYADRPWRFALYSDEVTPGNVLSPDNLRKAWVIYWVLLGRSMQSLADQEAWFLLTLKDSSEVVKTNGGISAVFANCLQLFFTGAANDVSFVGVLLEFQDGWRCRLWLRMDQMMQDDASLKYVWSCVGASGTRFCMCCMNTFSDHSGEKGEEGEDVLATDCARVRELHFASDVDVYEAMDVLGAYAAVPGMTLARLKVHQQHLGLRITRTGCCALRRCITTSDPPVNLSMAGCT